MTIIDLLNTRVTPDSLFSEFSFMFNGYEFHFFKYRRPLTIERIGKYTYGIYSLKTSVLVYEKTHLENNL